MFCPNCGYEYREGFTKCSDCGVALVEELPAEETSEETAHDDDSFAVVLQTFDQALVAVAQSILEAGGIPFYVRGENLPDLLGFGRLTGFNPIFGPVEILVGSRDEAAARALLAELEADSPPGE